MRLWTVALILIVRAALADASVTLAWDASPSPEVTGYRIYYGVGSRSYTNVVTVGNVLTATVTGLKPGVTYYFAATAFEGSGLESDFSNEVSYTVPVPRPAPAGNLGAQQFSSLWSGPLRERTAKAQAPPATAAYTRRARQAGLAFAA